jgi:hypothetical protein
MGARRVVLRTAVVVAAGLTVLLVVLWVATTVDARPPTVASVAVSQPIGDDDRRAAITTSIQVTFSEPVDPDSAAAAVSIEPAIVGSISWSGTTLTFTPDDLLPLEASFTVSVASGVRDLNGNPMTQAPEPFTFETAGRPELITSEPTDGAEDVAIDAPIRLTFSTLMDTPSVEAALSVQPALNYTLRWAGDRLEIVPDAPLRTGISYTVEIDTDAADAAGVTLAQPIVVRFRTLASELEARTVIPADGQEGVSVATPLALIFDRPIDPESLADAALTIDPPVAGSIDLVAGDADGPEPPDAPTTQGLRVLRFTPSSPLPPTTTFEVTLAPGLRGIEGGELAAPVSWSFTTGAPVTVLSNQIVFISERSGIANLWAMNQDGTGLRQLSSELRAVIDYAVAPSGQWIVVGDGQRLVRMRPDGSDRRMLTEDGALEFDPTFSPDGRRLAFARADAETGGGLGLWERGVEGGDARAITLPLEVGATATPSPSGTPAPAALLRAPRYAPDGQALAFIDTAGRVGIVELPAERLTTAAFRAVSPPSWLPDSSGILIGGAAPGNAEIPQPGLRRGPIGPLDPLADATRLPVDADQLQVGYLARSGTRVEETAFGPGATSPSAAAGGRLAYLLLDGQRGDEIGGGQAVVTTNIALGGVPVSLPDRLVAALSFGPEAGSLALEARSPDAATTTSDLWIIDPDEPEPALLTEDGRRPRWLP